MTKNIISNVNNKREELHRDAQKDCLCVGKGNVRSILRPIQASDFKNAYLDLKIVFQWL